MIYVVQRVKPRRNSVITDWWQASDAYEVTLCFPLLALCTTQAADTWNTALPWNSWLQELFKKEIQKNKILPLCPICSQSSFTGWGGHGTFPIQAGDITNTLCTFLPFLVILKDFFSESETNCKAKSPYCEILEVLQKFKTWYKVLVKYLPLVFTSKHKTHKNSNDQVSFSCS